MAVYREAKTNTWRAVYRYTDWKGERKQTQKRGFATKKEALAWEREQLSKLKDDFDMTFESFVKTYSEDMQSRLKENTWHVLTGDYWILHLLWNRQTYQNIIISKYPNKILGVF